MAELIMLRLEGVMQSWGEDAKWDTRPTAAIPSKSGIVGLIACAMGLERGDQRIQDIFDRMRIGIRSDRKGILITDFHTVQGMPDIYNAEGKKRGGNTIVSNRQYLQDASFLVVIDTDSELMERIAYSFESPVWSIYLGRKNCIPSRPVWDGIHCEYRDIYDALCHYPKVERSGTNREIELEQDNGSLVRYSRSDVLAGKRIYSRRQVWHGMLAENDKN